MCGIAGYVSKFKNITGQEMERITTDMTDAAGWRGPDGKGVYTDSHQGVSIGIGHCRLAVRDLSERGKQPAVSPDGNMILTYNGEIYNYREVRKTLEKKGHVFLSDCDTEVVLHACMEWGVRDAVCQFNGMWAFALYDRKRGMITLVRDRLGVKPLYYYRRNGAFAFCSDMRSLYRIPGFRKKISREALYGYLWNMYVPAPYTIFENVSKAEPGTLLEYDTVTGQMKKLVYWNVDTCHVHSDAGMAYPDYVSKLKKLLADSVRIRLEADVPAGVFLSGGIDSSLVASLAQEQSLERIHTYSIGFHEKEDDDAKAAKEVAGILGTQHQEMYCSQKDALGLIQEIPKAYSEPFADNSQIATMLLCRMTKKYVTVSLSGDGGDELFIGYPAFLMQQKLYQRRHLAGLASKTIGRIAGRVFSVFDHNRWKADKFCNAVNKNSILQLDYITAQPLLQLLLPLNDKKHGRLPAADYYAVPGSDKEDMLSFSVRQSMKISLPEDMLPKVDRASMYYSLECRCPLLDYRIAESSLSVPNSYKYRDGQLKAPLKHILCGYIPGHIIDRPKSGFGVPLNLWLHDELNEIVNDSLSGDFILRQGIFSSKGIAEFAAAFNTERNPILDKIAYNLLMFQLWWREYMDEG